MMDESFVAADAWFDKLLLQLSILSSILSLAWSVTAHKAIYKKGALDLSVAPVSRAVLLVSDLSFILSRIHFLILFMYYFGKGQFFPGMLFLLFHLILMICLHIRFSNDYQEFWERNHPVQFLHSCFLNGLSNLIVNNGVDILAPDTNDKGGKKNYWRNITYDLIFIAENIFLGAFGCAFAQTLDVEPEIREAINYSILVSALLHVLGLSLVMVYYKYLHL